MGVAVLEVVVGELVDDLTVGVEVAVLEVGARELAGAKRLLRLLERDFLRSISPCNFTATWWNGSFGSEMETMRFLVSWRYLMTASLW